MILLAGRYMEKEIATDGKCLLSDSTVFQNGYFNMLNVCYI